MPPELAPRVIVRGGKPVTTGGPFAESRELVGGFYVIDCEDAEDAARQAARIPTDGARGWIEARHLPLFHADPEYIARMKGLG